MVASGSSDPFKIAPPVDPRSWKTWDSLQPPLPGQLCYAVAFWRARKGCTWRPTRTDAIPPLAEGRYTIVWWESRSVDVVLRDAGEHNGRQLERARGRDGRVRLWAVAVQMVAGHDHTARILQGGIDHA